ncbi:MAG: DNA polymerase III subunit delta [Alphaproteobacteria bacterium]
MKVPPREAERFVSTPPEALRAVLVYGPDQGLVQERAEKLVIGTAGSVNDPFQVTEFPAADLADEPTRLRDEAAAISFTGGRRAVRVRQAGDRAGLKAIGDLLDDPPPGDYLVVVEAGDLPARSALRKLFEGASNGAALACYVDDEKAVRALARTMLGEDGITLESEAMDFLATHLGGDRLQTRREIEKLRLFAGPGGTLTLDDVIGCIGDSAMMSMEDVALAAGLGDFAGLDRGFTRAIAEGVGAVGLLRATLRHLRRLHQTRLRIERGMSEHEAMAALRPRVFFKVETVFRRSLARWEAERLAGALADLTAAESLCKTTGMPEELVCHRALVDIALLARQHAPRRPRA